MTISFKFFHDAALTQPIASGTELTATQETSGLLGPVDKTIYFGSINSANKIQAVSNPGVDAITVTPTDAAAGTGAPATEFKLALTSGGLATATAGGALSLSATINGGVANAIPVYTRRASALAVAGTYSDISLNTNSIIETPI